MTDNWPIPKTGVPLLNPQHGPVRRFFGLGEVRLAVLSLLDDGPKNGYQVMKELRERLGESYRGSAGTVYPVLKQIASERLVEARLKEGRNVYRLNREGRKLTVSEAASIEEIWSRAKALEGAGHPHVGPHTLVIATPLHEVIAAGVAAAEWSAGNADREDEVRAALRETAARLRDLVREPKARRNPK